MYPIIWEQDLWEREQIYRESNEWISSMSSSSLSGKDWRNLPFREKSNMILGSGQMDQTEKMRMRKNEERKVKLSETINDRVN